MTCEERPLVFDCEGERLVGILSLPQTAGDVGVVIVAGAPQYRVGAHRQFVTLARRLAAAGIAALRFDYRGSGDATGEPRSFEAIDADIAAAIDALIEQSRVRRVVLLGLCDGASAVVLYWDARRDTRIAAVALFNPWVRAEESLAAARVQGYYTERIRRAEFWRKLVRGAVDVRGAAASFAASLRSFVRLHASRGEPAFRAAMAEGFASFRGPVLIVLSERDLTAREFTVVSREAPWREALHRDNVVVRTIAHADHTFSAPACKHAAEACTVEWFRAHVGGTA